MSLADYLKLRRFADGGDADSDSDSDGGSDSYSDGSDDGSSGRSSDVTPGIASEVDPDNESGYGSYSGIGMANPGLFNDPLGWATYKAYQAVEDPVSTLANYAFGVPYMAQGMNTVAQAIGQGLAGITGTDPNAVEGPSTGHPGVDQSGPYIPTPQPQQPAPQQPQGPYVPSLADLQTIHQPMYFAMGGAVAPDIVSPGMNRPAMFADGGSAGMSGLINGMTPGRADMVNASLEPGAYIFPADVVSAAGDGNTQAGALELASRFGGNPQQANMADGGILAKVAHGEYYLSPSDAEAAGGAKNLNRFVKKTRSDYAKKLSRLPGPKNDG